MCDPIYIYVCVYSYQICQETGEGQVWPVKGKYARVKSVCVLDSKPLFLPVSAQHTHAMPSVYVPILHPILLERYGTSSVITNLRHISASLHCNAVTSREQTVLCHVISASLHCNAVKSREQTMLCHVYTTGTTYACQQSICVEREEQKNERKQRAECSTLNPIVAVRLPSKGKVIQNWSFAVCQGGQKCRLLLYISLPLLLHGHACCHAVIFTRTYRPINRRKRRKDRSVLV